MNRFMRVTMSFLLLFLIANVGAQTSTSFTNIDDIRFVEGGKINLNINNEDIDIADKSYTINHVLYLDNQEGEKLETDISLVFLNKEGGTVNFDSIEEVKSKTVGLQNNEFKYFDLVDGLEVYDSPPSKSHVAYMVDGELLEESVTLMDFESENSNFFGDKYSRFEPYGNFPPHTVEKGNPGTYTNLVPSYRCEIRCILTPFSLTMDGKEIARIDRFEKGNFVDIRPIRDGQKINLSGVEPGSYMMTESRRDGTVKRRVYVESPSDDSESSKTLEVSSFGKEFQLKEGQTAEFVGGLGESFTLDEVSTDGMVHIVPHSDKVDTGDTVRVSIADDSYKEMNFEGGTFKIKADLVSSNEGIANFTIERAYPTSSRLFDCDRYQLFDVQYKFCEFGAQNQVNLGDGTTSTLELRYNYRNERTGEVRSVYKVVSGYGKGRNVTVSTEGSQNFGVDMYLDQWRGLLGEHAERYYQSVIQVNPNDGIVEESIIVDSAEDTPSWGTKFMVQQNTEVERVYFDQYGFKVLEINENSISVSSGFNEKVFELGVGEGHSDNLNDYVLHLCNLQNGAADIILTPGTEDTRALCDMDESERLQPDASISFRNERYRVDDTIKLNIEAYQQGEYSLSVVGAGINEENSVSVEEESRTDEFAPMKPGTVEAELVAPGKWWNPLDSDEVVSSASIEVKKKPENINYQYGDVMYLEEGDTTSIEGETFHLVSAFEEGVLYRNNPENPPNSVIERKVGLSDIGGNFGNLEGYGYLCEANDKRASIIIKPGEKNPWKVCDRRPSELRDYSSVEYNPIDYQMGEVVTVTDNNVLEFGESRAFVKDISGNTLGQIEGFKEWRGQIQDFQPPSENYSTTEWFYEGKVAIGTCEIRDNEADIVMKKTENLDSEAGEWPEKWCRGQTTEKVGGEDCQDMVQQAQEYAEGKVCTQQVLDLQCPEGDLTYTAQNGCEISHLKDKGWKSMNEDTGTVQRERWRAYCGEKGYETSLSSGENNLIQCIQEQIVPEFFTGNPPQSNLDVPESLCNDLLGISYSQDAAACQP